MKTNHVYSLLAFAMLAVLLVPTITQARSRTGSDLSTRVAALEAQQAVNTADIATNAADIAAHVADTGNAHDHDARYVKDSGEDLRSFYGVINGAGGNVVSGSGFSFVRNGVGDYTITFDTPFPVVPSVQFVAGHGGLTFIVGLSSVDLLVFDNGGLPFDSVVMFYVVGAQ